MENQGSDQEFLQSLLGDYSSMVRDKGETEATKIAEYRYKSRLFAIQEENEDDQEMVSVFSGRRSCHYITGVGEFEEVTNV